MRGGGAGREAPLSPSPLPPHPPPRRGRDPRCPAGAAATPGAGLQGAGAWGEGRARPRLPAAISALGRRSQGSRERSPGAASLVMCKGLMADKLHLKAPPAGIRGEGAQSAVFGKGTVAPKTPAPGALSLASAGHGVLGSQVRTLPCSGRRGSPAGGKKRLLIVKYRTTLAVASTLHTPACCQGLPGSHLPRATTPCCASSAHSHPGRTGVREPPAPPGVCPDTPGTQGSPPAAPSACRPTASLAFWKYLFRWDKDIG